MVLWYNCCWIPAILIHGIKIVEIHQTIVLLWPKPNAFVQCGSFGSVFTEEWHSLASSAKFFLQCIASYPPTLFVLHTYTKHFLWTYVNTHFNMHSVHWCTFCLIYLWYVYPYVCGHWSSMLEVFLSIFFSLMKIWFVWVIVGRTSTVRSLSSVTAKDWYLSKSNKEQLSQIFDKAVNSTFDNYKTLYKVYQNSFKFANYILTHN